MHGLKKLSTATAVSAALSFCLSSTGSADRIDPSMIPPDVTLSTGSGGAGAGAGASAAAAAMPSAATPGLGGGAAGQLGQAGAPQAQSPQAASHSPGQPLPPGAVPSPPPPPTGSGSSPQGAGFGKPQANSASNYSMFQTSQTNGPSTAPDVSHDPIAVIETPKGTITLRLFKSLAPKTVANFEELAGKGFFNGLTFHRVEPNFCIQGGDPLGTGFGMYTDPATKQPRFIPLEIAPALKHNAPGVVAMAHGPSPNSASCQFYITLAPYPSLDGKYAIFGGVISGMDVVKSIAKGDKMTTVSVQMP